MTLDEPNKRRRVANAPSIKPIGIPSSMQIKRVRFALDSEVSSPKIAVDVASPLGPRIRRASQAQAAELRRRLDSIAWELMSEIRDEEDEEVGKQ